MFPATDALLLAAAGALAYWFKDVPGLVASWACRFFVSTMTVDSRDEFLFGALVELMDAHPGMKRVNQFTARSVRRGTAYQNLSEDLRAGLLPKAYRSPAEGLHVCACRLRRCRGCRWSDSDRIGSRSRRT